MVMKRMLHGSYALLTLSLLAAGCATTASRVEAPEVRLDGVTLLDADWTGQRFRLTFEALNPNAIPLPVRTVDYEILLAGQRFASGSAAESFTLPAGGQGMFSLDVDTNLLQSASMLATLIFHEGRREIDYQLVGSLAVDVPFTRPLRFNETGRVTLEHP